MKATLTKKINIQEATAYLVLEKEEKRPDIVDFLTGKRFDNPIINKRVRKYLQGIRLIDNQDNITKNGNKVLETGNVLAKEEGKYQIYFTDDYFIKDTILYFERQSPDRYSKNNIKPLNINFKENNYYLPIDNDFSRIKLNLDKEIEGVIKSNKNSIQLEWKWVDLDESSFKFSGKINNKNIKKNNIPANRDLKDAISKLFDNWDTNKEKLKVYFSDIENKEIESFEVNKNGQNFEFDYHFEQISIVPYNKQEAIKWRNWFINKEINEKYYLKYDFDKLVKEINNKEGFIDYRAELNTPEVQEYRNTIESKDRLKKSKSFWHLSAPLDLNPDNTGTQLDYQEDENVITYIEKNI